MHYARINWRSWVTLLVDKGSGKRRSEIEIEAAILRAIQLGEGKSGEARISRLQANVYISWRSLRRHIAKLRNRGLLEADGLRPTEKGLRFLRDYGSSVRRVLDDYGF
jgi:predicted transcriptional regulator